MRTSRLFLSGERRLVYFAVEDRDRILDADAPKTSDWQNALDAAKAKETDTLKAVRALSEKKIAAFTEPRFTVTSWSGLKRWWKSFESRHLAEMRKEHDAEQDVMKQQEIEKRIEAEAAAAWSQEIAAAESELKDASTDAQRYVLLQGRILNRDVALAEGSVKACDEMLKGLDAQIGVLSDRQKQFRDIAALVEGGALKDAKATDVEIPGMDVLLAERKLVSDKRELFVQAAKSITEEKKTAEGIKKVADIDALLSGVLSAADPSAAVDLDEKILEAVADNNIVRDGVVTQGAEKPLQRLEIQLDGLRKRGVLTTKQYDNLLVAVRFLGKADRASVLAYFAQKTEKRLKELPTGRELNPPGVKERVGMLAFMERGETVKIGRDSWSVAVPNQDDKFTVLVGERGERAVVERAEDGGAYRMRVRNADGRKFDAELIVTPLPAGARKDVLYLWPQTAGSPDRVIPAPPLAA